MFYISEYRYALMRLIRLVVTIASEIAAAPLVVFGALCFGMYLLDYNAMNGTWWFQNGYERVGLVQFVQAKALEHPGDLREQFLCLWAWMRTWHPFVLYGVMFCLGVFCACMAFGSTTAYHYQTKMPGINLKKCWNCKTMIPDEAKCPACGDIRVDWFFGRIPVGISRLVTYVWYVHDGIAIALGIL